MLDWNRWLPGLGPDEPEEEESAVAKTLRALGQVPDALGDIGRSAGQSVVGAVQGATQAVQDAYAVPTEQRPPQYSGPSYAPQPLPEGQRPYFAPTETESAAVGAGLQHAAAAEPIERMPIPFTGASISIPGPLQGPAGAVAGAGEALSAADQAIRARIDPRVWGFAHDGIRRELFSPEQLAREAYLRGTMDPETGARHTVLTQAEQDELAAMDAAVEQRYQQIKDDPDALTRYANDSPAYAATSAVTDIALTPALGAAAGGAATRGAEALGASARTARGVGYAADIAAQTVVDPTTPLTQGPLDAAVAGVRGAVGAARRLPGQIGSALEGNAQRVAAADARMAAEGSTTAPAVFGALPEPGGTQPSLSAARQALRDAQTAGDPAAIAAARQQLGQAIDAASTAAPSAAGRALETPTETLEFQGRRLAVEATGDPAAPFRLTGPRGDPLTLVPTGADGGRRYFVQTADGQVNAGTVGQLSDGSLLHLPTSGPRAAEANRIWRADLDQQGTGTLAHAAFGLVPDRSAKRVWVPDARYTGGGFWRRPTARVPDDLRAAQRDGILANADHLSAVSAREKIEAQLTRAPDDYELQQALMNAMADEERAKDTLDAAREWYQMVSTGDKTLATAGTLPAAARGVYPERGTSRGDPLAAVNRVLGQGAISGVTGTTTGLVNQEMNPDDPNAFGKGFVVGAVAPPLAARAARGAARLAGRGVDVGGGALSTLGHLPGDVDPDEVADLARRAAQTPMTGPHTNAEHTVRNVAQQIRKQADRGVAPEVPDGPMLTPKQQGDPNLWDWAQAVRYGLGLFGNLSTAMVQAGGGLAEVGLGVPEEIIRRAILRGRPEALPQIASEAVRSVPGALRAFGRTAVGEVPEEVLKGSDYRAPLAQRLEAAGKTTQAHIANAIEFPGRVATQAPDAAWNEVFYRTGLAQAAADVAEAEPGLSRGERLRRQAELTANPTPEIEAEARRLAEDATYKGDLGYPLGLIEKFIRGGPDAPEWHKAIGSALMPVYHTIARIHEGALERTPGVGLLPLDRMKITGRRRPLDQRIAQQVTGLGFVGGLSAYAANGGIRGPGPSDPNEAQALRDLGREDNTINVAGYWVPTSWFGRLGPIINEVGAIHDAMLYDDKGKNWSEASARARWDRIITGSAKAFADYPAADAASTLLDLTSRPSEALAQFVGQYAAQYTPGFLRTIATGKDPYVRRPERGEDISFGQRVLDTAMQRSGIGRETLPAAQDILGRPVPNPRQGVLPAILPRVGADKRDPVIEGLVSEGVLPGDAPSRLSVGHLAAGYEPPELTQAERRRWDELRGSYLSRLIEPVLGSEQWARTPKEQREAWLEQQRTKAAEAAHTQLRTEIGNDEIRRRIEEARGRKAAAS